MSSSPNSSSSSEIAATGAGGMDWVMDVPCPVDFVLGTATVWPAPTLRCSESGVMTNPRSA